MEYQSNIEKILKYFIVFGIIYLAVMYIPTNRISFGENLMISMIASVLFAFLDIYFPSVTIKK